MIISIAVFVVFVRDIRYPLLWNRPAESQDELIMLMELLEQVHGIPQQDQIQLIVGNAERSVGQRFPSVMNRDQYQSITAISIDTAWE